MDRQEILNRLMAFPYDRDEYWVITGSAMVMYGIKEHAGDIDLGCSVKMADLLDYLLIEGGKEELRGEAYRISNGNMLQVSKANDTVLS